MVAGIHATHKNEKKRSKRVMAHHNGLRPTEYGCSKLISGVRPPRARAPQQHRRFHCSGRKPSKVKQPERRKKSGDGGGAVCRSLLHRSPEEGRWKLIVGTSCGGSRKITVADGERIPAAVVAVAACTIRGGRSQWRRRQKAVRRRRGWSPEISWVAALGFG